MIVLRTFLSLGVSCLFSGTWNIKGYAADEITRYRQFSTDIGQRLQPLLNSCSEILFLSVYILGGVLFGASLVRPDIALSGMISVISACLFARLIHLDKTCLPSGFLIYNPLIVGFSIGYSVKISALSVFLIACAGIATSLLTVMIRQIFRE